MCSLYRFSNFPKAQGMKEERAAKQHTAHWENKPSVHPTHFASFGSLSYWQRAPLFFPKQPTPPACQTCKASLSKPFLPSAARSAVCCAPSVPKDSP